MKIAVLLKQTFDTEAKIVIDANGQISKQGVSLVMNPLRRVCRGRGFAAQRKERR